MEIDHEEFVIKLENNIKRFGLRKPISLNIYIRKILKEIEPITFISFDALSQLNCFLKIFAEKLATVAIQITFSKHQIVNALDLETATKIILPNNLANGAIQKANLAIEEFKKDKDYIRNKAKRCNLIVPPCIAEKFLKEQSVSSIGCIHMAAVIEYIAKTFLSEASIKTHAIKKQIINIRHLYLATQSKPDLLSLMNTLKVIWIGGGVVEEIHPTLIPTREKKRKLAAKRRKARIESGETPTPINARRALPCVKTLRDIRKLQKSTIAVIAKEQFYRFLTGIVQNVWGEPEVKIYFAKGVRDYLQLIVEDKVIKVCKEAVNAMIFAGRETMDDKDLIFVMRYMLKDNVEQNGSDLENSIGDPALHRLTLKAGAKRIKATCYPILNEIIAYFTFKLCRSTLLLLKRYNQKTITLSILRKGAGFEGINLPCD